MRRRKASLRIQKTGAARVLDSPDATMAQEPQVGTMYKWPNRPERLKVTSAAAGVPMCATWSFYRDWKDY